MTEHKNPDQESVDTYAEMARTSRADLGSLAGFGAIVGGAPPPRPTKKPYNRKKAKTRRRIARASRKRNR